MKNTMFEILNKYSHYGLFEFHADDNMSYACNAPTNKSGVYIIWSILESKRQLLNIGRSDE